MGSGASEIAGRLEFEDSVLEEEEEGDVKGKETGVLQNITNAQVRKN